MKKEKDALQNQLKWAISIVIVVWIAIPSGSFLFFGKPDNPGILGDTFGVVNALFSSLAFALLIYTSLMQREELELQRKELEMTREELKRSADAQNILVELTKEQLDIQKLVRKNQVKPELDLADDDLEWETFQDNEPFYTITIRLKVRHHKLKLSNMEILTFRDNFRLYEDEVRRDLAKHFEVDENIFLLIRTNKEVIEHPIGLQVGVQFTDIDSRLYEQTILCEAEKRVFITAVREYWNKASQ